MQNLLREPLFYIFFVYGLSFILVFVMILKGSLKAHAAPIVRDFYLLAFFGLTHGVTELLDWMRFILRTRGQPDITALNVLSQTFLVMSFVVLLQFGINLLTANSENRKARSAPLALFALLIAIVLVTRTSDVFAIGLLARYSFGFLGAFLSAVALYKLAHSFKFFGNQKLLVGLNVAAAAFLCYALFGGLVIRPIFGVPIQLFRSACAVAIAISSFAVLEVYRYVKEVDQGAPSVAASCTPPQ